MMPAKQLWIPLSRKRITQMKMTALRRGVWYKVLTKLERACIDLVIKVVERVRGFLLRKILSPMLTKLAKALESQVERLIRDVGGNLAQRVSQIAQKWGNKMAKLWAKDARFIRFLSITFMNAAL